MKKCDWHTIRGGLVILLLLGLALVVLNFNNLQGQMAHAVSSNQTELRLARHYRQKKQPDYNLKHVKPISPQSLIDAWRQRQDYRAVGQIAIRDKNIKLNIYRGTGNNELALGVGTFWANQKMGQNNYSLAGHNMDDGQSYFSPLYTAKVNGTLRKGMAIFLTDFKKVYFYKITSSRFIDVANLRLSFNRKKFRRSPVISLFTCDYTGQGRLFVRGRLTGSQSLKSASRYVKSAFGL